MSKSNPKLLFILTGSIATYKVCQVLSDLKKQSYQIKVIATQAALKFIGLSTLEGLTSEKVSVDLYENGSNMDHIHLIRWADMIVTAPATANYINKMALGIGDDLASTVFLAHDFQKPFLVFPAMNTKMYLHPTVQSSIQKLKNMGIDILDSASGVLACGETGVGRLLEPQQIIHEIQTRLGVTKTATSESPIVSAGLNKKILISSGGTQEKIDDIRVITNKSTGQTAAFIADAFIENGFDVTYLAGENAKRPMLDCHVIPYTDFKSLDQVLDQNLLNQHHVFIHTAAVSDYSVVPQTGKINSDAEKIEISMIRNPKIINKIKKMKPDIKLIGFKLTSTLDVEHITSKVGALFNNAHCDVVIHNDWSTIKADHHVFNVYKSNELKNINMSKNDLAQYLITESL